MATTVNNASDSSTTVRYHGLDALRAWAMSIGIVLHAAWIMIPNVAGTPMPDASASNVTKFICLGIHTFRMQLFFVLAGLFACLLIRRRGIARFATNRLQRIVLPLVVFWLIISPIITWQFISARIAAGSIGSEQSAWQLTWAHMTTLTPGSLSLAHLWFLYFLCLIYVMVIATRGLAAWLDPHRIVRDWISARFRSVVTWPAAPLILAGVFAPLLMPMKGTSGVVHGDSGLIPSWPGLLTYTGYFVAGWLIFRNIDQLGSIVRGWRWQLVAGCLLLIPYFMYTDYAAQHGYATPKYPMLTVRDLRHEDGQPVYPELRTAILSADPESVAGKLRESLPAGQRQFMETHSTATDDQVKRLLGGFNRKVLQRSEFTEQLDLAAMPLSPESRQISEIPADKRTEQQNLRINREVLDAALAGLIYSEDVNRPYYYPLRAAYCYLYSLITWLFILGCIGFSQHFFDNHSRFWRYFSDSAYWFYLAHLPIQFQLLLWVGDEPWHWSLKFTFYVVVTVAVLLPTYHFLVRPTWLGWFLNGRMASVWSLDAAKPARVASQHQPGVEAVPVSDRSGAASPARLQAVEADDRKVSTARS